MRGCKTVFSSIRETYMYWLWYCYYQRNGGWFEKRISSNNMRKDRFRITGDMTFMSFDYENFADNPQTLRGAL